MRTFASIEDLEARLTAPLMDSDKPRARALLEDATAVILAYVGWPEVPVPCPGEQILRIVCLNIAVRCFNNPLGITSESMGDYSYRRSATAVSGLYLTEGDKDTIDQTLKRSRVKSVPIGCGITDADRRIWSEITWVDQREYYW